MRSHWQAPLSALTALFLAACGGGGDDGGVAPRSISGVVVDGYIENATVFLDLNHNAVRDANEPVSRPTGANGVYTLDTTGLTRGQVARGMLVASVPAGARDSDFPGQTLADRGIGGLTLLAPAAAFVDAAASGADAVSGAVISPLTTLVAWEMLRNDAALAEARTRIDERLRLNGRNPMTDFVASGDTALHAVARKTATAFGELARSVDAAAAGTHAGASAHDRLMAVLDVASIKLPTLVGRLETAPLSALPGAGAAPSAAELGSWTVAELRKHQPAIDAAIDASLLKKSRHLVVFRDSVANPEAASAAIVTGIAGGTREFVYQHALKGFAVSLPATSAASFLDAMAAHPDVAYVHADQDRAISVAAALPLIRQGNAPWGLDRIDQRDLPLDTAYAYDTMGTGVTVHVLDTGVDARHRDFGGRVLSGYSAMPDAYGTDDCHGHGTHVAGVIAGRTYGVAKEAAIVPVRVADCTGKGVASRVIAGIDWVAANAAGPSVMNLSLSGADNRALRQAVAGAIARGISVVAAAGNNAANACAVSPANAPGAIAVGATHSADGRARYSNWGRCIDLFAPGEHITSTAPRDRAATYSGTSIAAAHVSGAVARLLGAMPANSKPADVEAALKAAATRGKVTDPGVESPNLLLFTAHADILKPPHLLMFTAHSSLPTTAVRTIALDDMTRASEWISYSTWRGSVTILVQDTDLNMVPGVTATGTFTPGGSVECVTSINGACTVSAEFPATTDGPGFSLDGLSGDGMNYDSALNGTFPMRTISIPASNPFIKTVGLKSVDSSSEWVNATTWRSHVRVTIQDQANMPVAGVRALGKFTDVQVACLTDADGSCWLSSLEQGPPGSPKPFQLITLSGNGIVYDSGTNAISDRILVSTPPVTASVSQLAGFSFPLGSVNRTPYEWQASVAIEAKDNFGRPVTGAIVRGQFTAETGSVACTVTDSGFCTVGSTLLFSTTASTEFKVLDISAPGLTYLPDGNTVSSVIVSKPR